MSGWNGRKRVLLCVSFLRSNILDCFCRAAYGCQYAAIRPSSTVQFYLFSAISYRQFVTLLFVSFPPSSLGLLVRASNH